jgi:hypothetical protein
VEEGESKYWHAGEFARMSLLLSRVQFALVSWRFGKDFAPPHTTE